MEISKLHSLFLNCTAASTDTRKIEESNMFFALKGPNFNGNEYAAQALEAGAKYAIIDEQKYKSSEHCIVVENVLTCLQELARYHRLQFNFPIIGITGSNGKTTTKELLNAVFSQHLNIHATQGNLNNHIGVPLTLLQLNSKHELAIIEMGANHLEEIKELAEIACPNFGLITNVGKAHLEGFGSFEGVRKTKAELYDYLIANNGVTFLNEDEEWLPSMFKGKDHIGYDSEGSEKLGFELNYLSLTPSIQLHLAMDDEEFLFDSPLFGIHNYKNILTAICLGIYFKIPIEKIIDGVSSYQAKNNRSEIRNIGSRQFILDAYNANPGSMKMALDNFLLMDKEPKVLILGDMLELGNYSHDEHLKICDWLIEHKMKGYLIGSEFSGAAQERKLNHFENVDALKTYFKEHPLPENALVLLKGSRGIRLEKLLEDL